MATNTVLVQAMADPEGQWELALIDEFLRARGLDAHTLHSLPEHEEERVLAEASVYASAKLAEVEARAHFVHEIHRAE